MKKKKHKIDRIDVQLFLLKFRLYSIIILSMLIISYFSNRMIETPILFICYLFMRYAYPKTFHCDNVYWCVFWSIIMFYLAIPKVLPTNLSVLSSVMVSALIGLILYKIQLAKEHKQFADKHKEKFENKTVLNLCFEDLDKIAKEHLSERDYSFFMDMYNQKLNKSTIARKYATSKSNTYNWYKSLINKLNKFLN